MKNQNTNEFASIRKNNHDKNKIFLSIAAVVFALLAIVVAVMISVAMNMNPAAPNPPIANDTTDTTEAPADTTVPPETTTPNTTVSIIPGPDSPGTTATTLPQKNPPTMIDGKYTICVDPGHGYTDTGAGSEFLGDVYESEIVMVIAHHVKDYLIDYGYNVVMTHEDNTPPPGTYGDYLFNKITRIDYVNKNFDYDYYVSIHCNSFTQEYVSGTRIYYHAPNNANNTEINKIADILKAGIASALPDSKTPSLHPLDTKDAFYVCKYAESYASMLVETGFVTNKSDAEKMLDEQWRKDMAKGIADGIHAYFVGLN